MASAKRARSEAELEALALEAEEADLHYDSDDSENERELLTIGHVPREWYAEHEHLGYDLEGRPVSAHGRRDEGADSVAQWVQRDKHPWSVLNRRTGRRELLSAAELAQVHALRQRLEAERYAPEHWHLPVERAEDRLHATSQAPVPKRRFVPSRWEAQRVRRLVHAIRKGWISLESAQPLAAPVYFDAWSDQAPQAQSPNAPLPAPRQRLPGHAESYNTPTEYLFDADEMAAWSALDPEERTLAVPPVQRPSLRLTPAYARFQQERFHRCLDLYLAVRAQKKRPHVTDASALLPVLPKARDLRPFPRTLSLTYCEGGPKVRSLDVDASGRWLAAGDDDGQVRVWDVASARLVAVLAWPDVVVKHVTWQPEGVLLAVVTSDSTLRLLHFPSLCSSVTNARVNALFARATENSLAGVVWSIHPEQSHSGTKGIEVARVTHIKTVERAVWHARGDYLATYGEALLLHQLSHLRSQAPFAKSLGQIMAAAFHPTKPYLLVATQRHVRVFHLVDQRLVTKLSAGIQWIASGCLAVHPSGDHVLVGGYDAKVCWFDLDLRTTPYKTLRYHAQAVRSVRFHPRFPLFASCGDEGRVHVLHGSVHELEHANIVPLVTLRGHSVVDDLAVLDLTFHPKQPWLVSAGSDGKVLLYV